MGEKDIAEKYLEDYNDVFSDIVNNLVFDGACVVDERDLEQARARSVYQGENKMREQERDLCKYWKKKNIRIALLGFENQTSAEDDMPFIDGLGDLQAFWGQFDITFSAHRDISLFPKLFHSDADTRL